MSNQQNVNNVNFSAKQRDFINWLANPKSLREPKDQKSYCEKYNLTEETLSRWKKLPGFMEAVKAKIEEMAGDDDADIIQALKVSATIPGLKGSADRRTYLQWRKWLVEKQDISLQVKRPPKPLNEMTDEELDAWENELRSTS